MTHPLPNDLIQPIKELEDRILATPYEERSQLQSDLHALCLRLEHEGYELPARLRHLDRLLTDSVTEAQFDNLPV